MDNSVKSTDGVDSSEVDRAMRAMGLIQRAFYVAGRVGQPGEGRLPFNVLYFHILTMLLDKGSLRPGELAQRLGTANTTLSTASKALEQRGLLAKRVDPNDRRARLLALTESGVDVAQAIQRQDRRNVRFLLERIESSRLVEIVDILESTADRLE